MAKRWKRVPFDADVEIVGTTIIRISRGKKGDVMANVESLAWFEPDGHEHTGYAAGQQTDRRPAAEVLAEYKKMSAVVAIESDDLWNPEWGELVS